MHHLTLDDRWFDHSEWDAFQRTLSELRVIGSHQLSGQPLKLCAWQSWVYGSILCWKWKTGDRAGGRVFSSCWVEVARGAGKTTASAALFLHLARQHNDADFVCLANTLQQSEQAFRSIGRFAIDAWGDDQDEDPDVAKKAQFKVRDRYIKCLKSKSMIKTRAAKSHTLDGLDCLGYLVDESSEQTSDFLDKIESALGKSLGTFMLSITTPGGTNLGRESPYYQKVKAAHAALERDNWDTSTHFAALFGIDDDDDIHDESCWIKGQPSLGHVIPFDTYREMLNNYTLQGRLGSFERFQLCRYSTKSAAWLPEGLWEKASRPIEMPGLDDVVVAAVDFSKSFDLTSCCYMWWRGDRLQVRWHHWAIRKPDNEGKRDYQKHLHSWEDLENVTICDHSVQYDSVYDFLWQLKRRCRRLARIGYDALGGMQTMLNSWGDVDEKYNPETQLPMFKVPQTITTIGPATYLVEGFLRSGRIDLQDCPVAEYARTNVAMETNVNGDRRPSKARSGGIIDPVVAMCMAGHCLSVEGMQKPGAYQDGLDIAI
jgi:phage terminase large subunit-like protein